MLQSGMVCRLVFASLLLGACSSGSPVQGAVLTKTLGSLDGAAYDLKQVEEFVLEAGDEPLSVRVEWTFAKEQGESQHPFGAVEVNVERNDLEASNFECSLGEPTFALLLNGDRVWNVAVRCSYAADGRAGEAEALLWANGLFTQHVG